MRTFAAAWAAAVDQRADAPFVAFEGPDGVTTSWTYGQFDGLDARVAGGLPDRGQPDPVRDEGQFDGLVARDPAAPPSPDELRAWCDERLTKAKRPRGVTVVDELPRTSVGKIRKFLLKDAAAGSTS